MYFTSTFNSEFCHNLLAAASEQDLYFGLAVWRHKAAPNSCICCDSAKERFVLRIVIVFNPIETVQKSSKFYKGRRLNYLLLNVPFHRCVSKVTKYSWVTLKVSLISLLISLISLSLTQIQSLANKLSFLRIRVIWTNWLATND